MSTLLQVTAHFKRQLAARELQAQRTMIAAHKATLTRIQPQLDKLYVQIKVAYEQHEKIPPSWLYEQYRLEHLKQVISHQIDQFAAGAQVTVDRAQDDAASAGMRAAIAQLQSTLPKGATWNFGTPSQQALQNIVGATQKGSPLARLFQGFGTEAAQKAADALSTGLSLGNNPREVARDVRDALDISLNRARTIARTEMMRAYRESHLETYRENSDVVDKWVWTASLGSACAACSAMNGEEFPLDEEMDSHVNCRCTPVPVTKSWADILGSQGYDTSDIEETTVDIPTGTDWFAQQDAETQRRVLGSDAKYELYKSGQVTLKDFVGIKKDKEWGNSVYVKSLEQLKGGAS